MDNLSASDIESHMVNIISACVKQQIAWLHIIYRNGSSLCRLISGASACADTEMSEYAHSKTGTVCSICKARPAIYIWIAQKLLCISYNCISGSGGYLR